MSTLDYVVLLGTMLGIVAYGMWRTRGRRSLETYLKGEGHTPWFVIGLSVIATQASATTFLSIPGQGYQDGLSFVQNYFGAPLAMIVIAAVFLPIYRKLNVYTAYEYLGQRFDQKTRLLGAALFLVQRGLGAGLTIYAPAIVLSTILGWPLDATIIGSGVLATIYTVTGGNEAVTVTQKYQIALIFAGMLTAFVLLLEKLPAGLGFGDALTVAGSFHKLNAVSFSVDPHERYTVWTGTLGGMFLALSYFGTDQSQVQRYLTGGPLRESRLGLMFHAVCKIPMQFCILLLGVLIFVFYQFETPPVNFNETAWREAVAHGAGAQLRALEQEFTTAHAEERQQLQAWLTARQAGDTAAENHAKTAAALAHDRLETARAATKTAIAESSPGAQGNDSDYVFINFILHYLPHGVIGLLIAAFFAATFSSKAAEISALGSTTTVDFYRFLLHPEASDAHCVAMSKVFTGCWGLVAICFALFANLQENLVQAVNIVGSLFYGAVLGLFLLAFFVRWVRGTAAFWGALAAQVLVIELYNLLDISYLWYNLLGPAICILFGLIIQLALPKTEVSSA